MVHFRIDPKNLPPVTDEQRRRLDAIAAMPDKDINYSDIPCQTDKVQWTQLGTLLPTENKQPITLRFVA